MTKNREGRIILAGEELSDDQMTAMIIAARGGADVIVGGRRGGNGLDVERLRQQQKPGPIRRVVSAASEGVVSGLETGLKTGLSDGVDMVTRAVIGGVVARTVQRVRHKNQIEMVASEVVHRRNLPALVEARGAKHQRQAERRVRRWGGRRDRGGRVIDVEGRRVR